MVVLVHGYLGSYREQEYLGEALMNESRKALSGDESCRNSKNNSNSNNKHEFVVLNSRVNSGAIELTTDGIAAGGKRLASEVTDWVEQQIAEVQKQSKSSSSSSPTPTTQTVMTLSFVGNSLGGLYSRYALAELETVFGDKHDNSNDNSNHDNKTPSVLPMIFCTTSSPHLGVSQETFIELPKWTEPYVSSVFRQKTMDDLFGVHESTVVADLCHANNANTNNKNNDNNNNNNCDDDDDDNNTNFLRPLGRFRKRIAMANAYNTDFLVSVASGAFLSAKSNSVHHHQDSDVVAKSSIRLMRDLDHVALQVATLPPENDRDRDRDDGDERASRTKTKTKTRPSSSSSSDNGGDGDGDDGDGDGDEQHDTSDCVDALDELGWLKIFVDTRGILPKVLNFDVENLTAKHSYTSRELHEHFRQYGTMLPVAHPLNMANSKTDWYRLLTKSGRPVVDALAELLVRDTIELSEEEATTTTTTTKTTTATKTTTKSGSCEGGNANGNDGNVGNEL